MPEQEHIGAQFVILYYDQDDLAVYDTCYTQEQQDRALKACIKRHPYGQCHVATTLEALEAHAGGARPRDTTGV